ncbi:hypothetical protein BDY17DRAFT_187544 [Neohortaea acidophila]|uniref:DUF7587 domain-containing protein n=1 Tax=Neohortaea acidophila TaxID=245834 RepID=A0A6A6PPK7_9PEZI|nr:uncharacterized protein BDY17DRAFT_187544 [Neohortaea acidophila]KAF2481373.1 hypothetical protein BDY17DRAFT_187544 [Neohortaea acidophila]
MDQQTKSKLEALRPQVPRFLFRAWHNNASKFGSRFVSGGTVGLNTTKAITPLAFYRGDAPKSVYELTREDFGSLASAHVCGEDSVTPFSSWSASLTFVLAFLLDSFAKTDDIYISIIDTKELWASNPVFWVPSLLFLPDYIPNYEEYLLYGVVQGRWHKSVPLRKFLDARLGLHGIEGCFVNGVTPESMERAATVARAYGPDFALPVYLAIFCEGGILPNGSTANLNAILGGIAPVDIPLKWADDTEVKPWFGYPAVLKFCNLLKLLAKKTMDNDKAFNPLGENRSPNRKRAHVVDETDDEDSPATKKRVRIEASTDRTTNKDKKQPPTMIGKRTFDDDDEEDDYYIYDTAEPVSVSDSDSDSEPEPKPAPRKARHTTSTATPKKLLKPMPKKPTVGVTTRRMSKAGKSVFKGPGVSTRRASVAMEGELKKLVIDMKD